MKANQDEKEEAKTNKMEDYLNVVIAEKAIYLSRL